MAETEGTGSPAEIRCDAVVVGAGFSGVSMLYRLRQLGLDAKIFESGDYFGGTWYWNRYPGARVDSEFPFYQLNIPEVYNTWTFSERFPDHRELRRYFAHADKILNLSRDTYFNHRVQGCTWDEQAAEWTVQTSQGRVAKARFLLLCTGLLHQKHLPDFPGLADFKGQIHHSAFYPENLDLKGKRVALVGMGATAVQITQEVAKIADRLTIFMRRPSLCLPAMQRPISEEENLAWHGYLEAMFRAGRTSQSGFLPVSMPEKNTLEVSPEEREALWERLYRAGGFRVWGSNYQDITTDKEANALVYEFWAKKTRARMTDPVKMDLMAPLPASRMPYHIFTKRPPLEMDYYEMIDRPNVELVNLKQTPTKTFNATGVLLENGRQIDFDVLILATGFDAFSGSYVSLSGVPSPLRKKSVLTVMCCRLINMGLKSRDGVDVRDYWKNGIRAYLGTTIAGYPNAFMTYTPYAPTALSNGTSMIELQCDFAVAAIKKILDSPDSKKIKAIEALPEAEDEWARLVESQSEGTLFPLTESWWTGANIPGRKSQLLTYLDGMEKYEVDIRERLDRLEGFEVRYWDGTKVQRPPTQSATAAASPAHTQISSRL